MNIDFNKSLLPDSWTYNLLHGTHIETIPTFNTKTATFFTVVLKDYKVFEFA